MSVPKLRTKADYLKRTALIREVEKTLELKLQVEKAMIGICLRYPSVNLKSVVKDLLEGDLPIVEGQELNYELAATLGRALEDYTNDAVRKADVTELMKKWTPARRRRVLRSV